MLVEPRIRRRVVVDDHDVPSLDAASNLADPGRLAGVQHHGEVHVGLLTRRQYADGVVQQETEAVGERRRIHDDGCGATAGEPRGQGDFGAGAVAVRIDVSGQQRPLGGSQALEHGAQRIGPPLGHRQRILGVDFVHGSSLARVDVIWTKRDDVPP
ncbi:MAG: hypothetical protein P8Z36_15610 [Gemmatimonadota bacterium]